MGYIYEDEDVKYRSKKKKKTPKKSDHKHIYEECLFIWDNRVHRGERCSICGKVGDVHFFETEPCENSRFVKMISGKQVLDKYPDLDIYDYNTGEKINRE